MFKEIQDQKGTFKINKTNLIYKDKIRHKYFLIKRLQIILESHLFMETEIKTQKHKIWEKANRSNRLQNSKDF